MKRIASLIISTIIVLACFSVSAAVVPEVNDPVNDGAVEYVDPSNVGEEVTSEPVDPSIVTEEVTTEPVDPSSVTEEAATDPVDPSSVTEEATTAFVDPSDIGEETTTEFIDPSNITEEVTTEVVEPSETQTEEVTTKPEIEEPTTQPEIEETTVKPETEEVTTQPETTQPETKYTEPEKTNPTKATDPGKKKETFTYVWNQYHNRICGKKYKDGRIEFVMSAKGSEKAKQTGNDLQYLLQNNKKKTIILPKKMIKIQRVLMPGNNTTLIATGATIYMAKTKQPVLTSYSTTDHKVYKPVKNLKVIGGKWRIKNNGKNSHATSSFKFMHSSNIKLNKLDIETDYYSHGIELIACKNVTIDGCKVLSIGKTKKNGLEEAIQIDIASKGTTFNVPAKYLKGQPCRNITVKNCTVRGGRGICANYTKTENYKWTKRHHTNITLIGNKVTGMTAEAVVLDNTAGIKVDKNTIISKCKKLSQTYSIGLNIASFGKNKAVSKKSISITNNTIKGGRQAIQAVTYNPKKSGVYGSHKLGKITIKNNKLYCKKGKKNCILTKKCKKVKKSKNKTYKW